MPKNYFSNKHGTLASRLDDAWADYQKKSLSDQERLKALDFMIYVFDIKKFSNEQDYLNRILAKLMAQRENKKKENPDFVPMRFTGKYQLETKAQILDPTEITKKSPIDNIQSAFEANELLDVNQEDKRADSLSGRTYLSTEQRAEYRIDISNGKFHKEGRVFDSAHLKAHNKAGYVAFTLNANGELSVFEHVYGELDKQGRKLTHSSMNAGAPVLAAGEMNIRNGKLISINTYSGHYTPSLYSVMRFLEYLSDKGIDISESKVYLQNPPAGLQSKAVFIKGDNDPWHEVPATAIVHSVKKVMNNNLSSLNDYLNSNKTRLFRDVFRTKLTQAKSEIAERFRNELLIIEDVIKDSSSLADKKIALEVLDSIITRYSKEFEKLNSKTGRLDSKFSEMKTQIQEAQQTFKKLDENKEQEHTTHYKSNF